MTTTHPSSTPFSAEDFRANFPPLTNMVHLASCSQGALSNQLSASLTAVTDSITDSAAPWGLWMDEVESLRVRIAAFINASPDEIAIVPSASEGAYQMVSSFDWSKGGAILTSNLEFPSVGHVLRAQQANGAEIRSIDDRIAALEADAWAPLIDEGVRLVSVPLVSYHDGSRADVAAITELAHAAGARVFVDAYQGAGVVPIDVKALDCDYLTTGSLKYMLGLAGVAFLYVRGGITSERVPELTGWFGRVDPFAFDPALVDYPETARRFESGTPAVPAVYAAGAGLTLLESIDQEAGWAHVVRLTDLLADGLTELGVELSRPSSAARRGPQVALYDDDPVALSTAIHERRVMSAPRSRLLRLSLHYYNTEADVQAALEAIAAARHGKDAS
ncbi:aminotransferase class V-fold PLP-dependent enzyme [Herbiconiux sp.]|uniref:aminotransferase class V-fold PLP-dependent enzyme n=1 Tax=Herbiconiux sp. TaxID=1871186 RepID=UPI0025C45BC6|nr:aminotransferase class V-fold PLP-dependent enzyme [Herbiconiux sp.]